jgi:hypothetical protein
MFRKVRSLSYVRICICGLQERGLRFRPVPDGQAVIKASWEFEPEFRQGGRMTKAELAVDLARYPRSARWRQPWMDELT